MSLKDQILATQDLPEEVVNVPEWDCKVTVRGLSVKQRDEWLMAQAIMRGGKVVGRDGTNGSAKLLVRCLRDENGDLIFGPEDFEVLGEKSAAVVSRVFEIAARLSGLDEEDEEETGKDSGQIPDSGSNSS